MIISTFESLNEKLGPAQETDIALVAGSFFH